MNPWSTPISSTLVKPTLATGFGCNGIQAEQYLTCTLWTPFLYQCRRARYQFPIGGMANGIEYGDRLPV